jgi:putative ABC transport system permease protein
MSKWLRYFEFFRRDPRRDIDDEIAMHFDLRVAYLREQGMTDEAATELARREFGDPAAVRDAVLRVDERMLRREHHHELIDVAVRDVRVALRSLRANPGFALSAILSAAAGIGVTTAILSASYSILVRPLPYRDSHRLVAVYSENTKQGWTRVNISYPDFASWRDESRALSGLAIWSWSTKTLAGGGGAEAERLAGADVSWNLFEILGVRPALGRQFLREEDSPGRHYETIISHELWQRRFGGDSTIVGKGIPLDGRPWTVVGVMPPGFNFPERGDYWVPFAAGPEEQRQNRGYAGAIGRLTPGVTLAQARGDLYRVDADLAARFPESNRAWRSDLLPLRDDLVGDLRDQLKVLLAAVALVLLLVCVNVANLALARGATRGREVAIRVAIGASRARIVRQLMTESLVIALVGGVLGVGIAWGALQGLKLAFPRGVPFYISLGIDGAALAFVVGVTVVTGILFGIMPAIRGSKVELNSALRDGGRSGSGVDKARLRGSLVVGEVALSAILLTGALLLIRTYWNLHDTPIGFTPHGVVSARLTLPKNAGYPTRAHVQQFFATLFERLRRDPRVESIGMAQGVPMTGWDVQGGVTVDGAPKGPGDWVVAHFQSVSPEYFKTIGVPLLRGRWLNETDRDTLNPGVLVTQQMLVKAFHGADPIGKRLRIGDDSLSSPVVGVVGDFNQYRLPQPAPAAMFFSHAAVTTRQMTIVLRAKRGDPYTLVPLLRATVRDIDANVALFEVQSLDDVLSRSLWRQRLMGDVVVTFAVLALAMACLGLYGVVSYAVTARKRELSVRLALGATRSSVLRLVFGQGARLVLMGITVGLVLAFFAVRILASLLYGVQPADPVTFAIVGVGLAFVALVATVIPSHRATRVDPIIAMRAE